MTPEEFWEGYLATLDDPAYGAASDVTPKFVSPSDPAAQWTGALRNAAFFAHLMNGDNVFVLESRGGASFTKESFLGGRVPGQAGPDGFERHLTLQN